MADGVRPIFFPPRFRQAYSHVSASFLTGDALWAEIQYGSRRTPVKHGKSEFGVKCKVIFDIAVAQFRLDIVRRHARQRLDVLHQNYRTVLPMLESATRGKSRHLVLVEVERGILLSNVFTLIEWMFYHYPFLDAVFRQP